MNSLTAESDKHLISPLSAQNHWLMWREYRKWSPTRGALDCETNSPFSTLRNIQRTVRRICILMLGCKVLTFCDRLNETFELLLAYDPSEDWGIHFVDDITINSIMFACLFGFYHARQIDSLLLWVCLLIDHRC